MIDYINLPFYTIKNNKLIYLNKLEIKNLPTEKEIRQNILFEEGILIRKPKKIDVNDTVLVIEPHPDDFALSVLGYTFNKYNAIVLNIFSKMNINSFTWLENIKIDDKEYEDLRLKESKIAVEDLLGQSFISLYQESTRINKRKNKNISSQIIQNVEKILNENKHINTLLIPMGIGNHPDHIIVHDILMEKYEKNNNVKIVLYPEYPYARCRKAYNERLEEMEKKYQLKKKIINVDEIIDILADAASIYKSQFDDINRNQMLAIIREDCRALAQENDKDYLSLIYYEIEGIKK